MRADSVVRTQAWRRWAVVLAVVALLCGVPVVLALRSTGSVTADPARLRAAMAASAGQPYQGYAISSGLLPLPALPNLAEVSSLLSTTTEMRAWYAATDRWRVDVIGNGTERDLYQAGDEQYVWDYGDNQLTRFVGAQPIRLPRAADLTPPELTRRLLGLSAADRVEPIAGRQVAGIDAAGLRIVPATADTTVAYADVWADPATGLPVQAEVTARGGERPVFTTRFLELALTTPDTTVLTPPPDHDGIGYIEAEAPDLLGAINRRRWTLLPDSVAGQPRRDPAGGVSAAGVYGTGLAQFVVATLPGRYGDAAFDVIDTYGRDVPVADGSAALLGTGLLTVLVVRTDRTYLVAGLVRPAVLERAAADLSAAAA